MKKTVILIFIIILATFFRLYSLANVPAGLDYDESEFAFNAYTLSKYLKNENNEFLPYQVNTYGNYRPLGLPYLIAVSLKIFGNTIFAVRLPNALFGVLSVLLIYIFVKSLFKNEKVALIAGLLNAISPWSVFLSRGTAEPVMALCFILLVFILMQKYWQRPKRYLLFLIYIFSFIGIFTYTGALPLMFLLPFALILCLFLRAKKMYWSIIIPFVVLVIFPIMPIYKTNPGYFNGRFKQTSIFEGMGKLGVELITKEQQQEVLYNRVDMQGAVNNYFHNTKINTINTILDNLTKHFSFEYLYFKGGEPFRLQVPNTGVFLLVEFIFLAGGALLLFQKKKYGIFFLAIFVILISFSPAGLTSEEIPSTHRPIFATIGFFMIESYFFYILSQKNNLPVKGLMGLIIIVFSYEMTFYLHNYFVMQPRHKNSFRHYEMNEVARLMEKGKNTYDGIYVVKRNTEPAYYYYFFNEIDPMPFLLNEQKSHRVSWDDGIFHYIHFPCADVEIKAKKALVIEEADYCGTKGKFIKYILNSDGTKILRVVEQ
jgi:4-amino-4-deoxy-L-arabinose transferase-like glycosyltransferase